MICYNIKNFAPFGAADYKGLDIRKNTPGSQVCLELENECYLINEELVQHTDLLIITEEEYKTARTNFENQQKQKTQSVEERISAVELAMAQSLGM